MLLWRMSAHTAAASNQMQYVHVPAWAIFAVLVALSSGVYLNTLFASFAFDDSFAVVRSRARPSLSLDSYMYSHGCQNMCGSAARTSG